MRRFVKAAIARLPRGLLFDAFFQAGRALGVEAYQVAGSQGRFFGPLMDQAVTKPYLFTGRWSENILEIILQALPSGGTFIDVGANIGLVSIPVSRHPNTTVIAFEPDPLNFALLSANVAYAGAMIRLENAAVSHSAGTVRFARSEYNSGDHRIAPDGPIEVRTVRLDDLALNDGPLVVKIDTQGAEPLVIRGGRKTIDRADAIVMEFWPWGMRRMGLDPNELVATLATFQRRAAILRHGEALGALGSMEDACAALSQLNSRGAEYDAADLVILR